MFDWLNSKGAAYKHHIPGQTNYLPSFREEGGEGGSKHPFPSNRAFVSESILSEELRNKVYDRVALQKASVRAVSAELGIDMRRVAAVVRLVELEKRQREQVSFLLIFRSVETAFPDAYDETTKKSISLEDSGTSPDWLESSLFTDLRAIVSTCAFVFVTRRRMANHPPLGQAARIAICPGGA